MPSILTRNYVANPLGIADFIDDLRTAALAFGWTVDDYQTNKNWSSGWVAGTENFLQLSSGGWGGNQGMVFRFRSTADGYLYFKVIDPNYPTYSSISTHPVFQNSWAPDSSPTSYTYSRFNLPTGSYPGNYFYGNDKFIACHIQVYTSVVFSFAFGTIDLFKPYRAQTNDLIFMWSGSAGNSYTYDQVFTTPTQWNCWTGWVAGATQQRIVWWDGASRYTDCQISTAPVRNETYSSIIGNFTKYGKCLTFNEFSGRTMALSPTCFIKKTSSGLWEPVGHYPCAVINFANLNIDEEITYGTETYRVMPTLFNSYPYGVAYRTA